MNTEQETTITLNQYPFCFLFFPSKDTLSLWENILSGVHNHIITPSEANKITDQFLYKLLVWDKKIYCTINNLFEYPHLQKTLQKWDEENNIIFLDHENNISLIKKIFEKNEALKSIAYLDSFHALMDHTVFLKLTEVHNKYRADYSFAENMPAGMVPKLIGKDILQTPLFEEDDLYSTKKDLPQDKLGMDGDFILSWYIEKNIPEFHVEIYYEEPDLRLLRLDFSLTNLRSIVKTSFFLSSGLVDQSETYLNIVRAINKNPEILHTFPSYIELELISDCEYACIFCPREYMDVKSMQCSEKSLNQIKKYLAEDSLYDTSIGLGGLGEPLQHPDIMTYMNALLSTQGLKYLIVETNGYYMNQIMDISKHQHVSKLRIIVNLNSIKNYGKIHGVPSSYFKVVKNNIENLVGQCEQTSFDKKQIIIQMLKIQDNQDEVDDIYNFAGKYGITFLLQKYNSYLGSMPERRVSDMTPLQPFSCWHLRRDMFIRANGDVVFCKQDIHGTKVRGNIEKEDLLTIWQSQSADFASNYKKEYSNIMDCAKCDEYFTFNL